MIRQFKQSDMDSIIDIWLNASIKAHNFINKDFWKSKINDMREIYIPSSENYVYEREGEIKGFVSLHNETISALFVSPKAQGIGIGTLLIKKCKEIRTNLNLTVYKENIKSINFYKNNGFKVTQEQIDEKTGHIELLMTYNS